MPGRKPLVIFSHANSFGAPTYNLLFQDLKKRGFALQAIDQFGHDPRYPVTSNWPHLVQQLIDFAQPRVQQAGTPVFFVGHSLGGFLSLMVASKAPALAHGVVLLDAPILGGWRATALGMAKRTHLVGAVSPGKVSRRRRNQWEDEASALRYFQSKRAFAHWHPQVLADYVTHGTQNSVTDGQPRRTLRFDRDVETAIYNTLPDNLETLLKQHPVRCPVTFIGGLRSAEMKQVGMQLTQRVTQGRIMMIDGSHLFPMEKPLVTGAAIETALLNMAV